MDPGFIFRPDDHELIIQFLCPKITGAGIHMRYIHVADVYSAAPEDLVKNLDHAPGSDKGDGKGGTWYFFCPARRKQSKRGGGRRQRTVASDQGCSWHSEGGARSVLDEAGRRVGYLRKLSYGTKKSPGATSITRLGWCMTEFGLDDQDDGWVLCKVYRSPLAKKNPPPTSTNAAGCKRKAAADQHSEAPHPRTARRETTADTASQHGRLQGLERWLLSDDDEEPICCMSIDVDGDPVQGDGALSNARRETMVIQYREMERWLLSDDDEPICMLVDRGLDVSSVDPAGFFSDILDVEGWLLQGRRAEEATEEDDDCRFECTLDELLGLPAGAGEMYMQPSPAPAPAFVSCDQSLHVAAERGTANCNLGIAHIMKFLAS